MDSSRGGDFERRSNSASSLAKTDGCGYNKDMHFPKFWTKANEGDTSAWGWSDASVEDAMAKAGTQLQRIRDWLAGERTSGLEHYGYPGRPMREEVLREFQDEGGRAIAAVSRNSQGCLVLNTVNMLFVDVDLPEKPSGGGGLLATLFGRKKAQPAVESTESAESRITAKVQAWLSANPQWGWRVYRTRAGFRLLATHQPLEPQAPVVGEAFAAFEADPLYRGLCSQQECFRARLTPKHWRCNIPRPPARWPWENEKAEAAFRKWEQRYLNAAKDFATCKLIGQFGLTEIHPALAELVEYHDKATRTDLEMPLA
ncbi:MAG: hypothetical protein WCD79_21805 [Chthoniobacteraceae bacterium]